MEDSAHVAGSWGLFLSSKVSKWSAFAVRPNDVVKHKVPKVFSFLIGCGGLFVFSVLSFFFCFFGIQDETTHGCCAFALVFCESRLSNVVQAHARHLFEQMASCNNFQRVALLICVITIQ